MTSDTLSMLAGGLLSLAFNYIPKFSDWYKGKTETEKKIIMLAALLIVSGGLFGASCGGWYELPWVSAVTCDRSGGTALLTNFFLALIANQGTFLISPRKAKVA